MKEVTKELESGSIFRPSRRRTRELEQMIRDHKHLPPDIGTSAMPDPKPAAPAASTDPERGHGVIYDPEDTACQPATKPSGSDVAASKPKKSSSISQEPMRKDKDFVSIKPEGNACHAPIYDVIYDGDDPKPSKKKKFETLIQMEEADFSPIYDEKEKGPKL